MLSNERQHVAVGVIRNDRNDFLLAKRNQDVHQGGLWEFPGGKLESGETVREALVRELHEELQITVTGSRPLITIPYDYPEHSVLLYVWVITDYDGVPIGAEGQQIDWVNSALLLEREMPAANYAIVNACILPEKYLITPEPGSSKSEWKGFLSSLNESVKNDIHMLQFRAKTLSSGKYDELARSVIEICREHKCKIILNTKFNSTLVEEADGIHLSSSQLSMINELGIQKPPLVSASCHTFSDIHHANNIGCDFIVLGPVNRTASHPGVSPIGWEIFSKMCLESKIPVYALGGMTPMNMQDAWLNGAQGISGISAFWVNTRV